MVDTWKAYCRAKETSYQFSSNLPLADIVLCYRIYYYDGTLEEFIDLIRVIESEFNKVEIKEKNKKDAK